MTKPEITDPDPFFLRVRMKMLEDSVKLQWWFIVGLALLVFTMFMTR